MAFWGKIAKNTRKLPKNRQKQASKYDNQTQKEDDTLPSNNLLVHFVTDSLVIVLLLYTIDPFFLHPVFYFGNV